MPTWAGVVFEHSGNLVRAIETAVYTENSIPSQMTASPTIFASTCPTKSLPNVNEGPYYKLIACILRISRCRPDTNDISVALRIYSI